jgi:hypothetical protein
MPSMRMNGVSGTPSASVGHVSDVSRKYVGLSSPMGSWLDKAIRSIRDATAFGRRVGLESPTYLPGHVRDVSH